MNGDTEQELLLSFREALSPKAADQARVSSGLAARIAAGEPAPYEPSQAPAGATGATSAPAAGSGLSGLGQQIIAAGLIGAIGFGAGYWVGRPSPESPAVLSFAASPVVAAPSAAAPVTPPALAPGSAAASSEAPPVKKAAAVASGPDQADMLSEEARELGRVDRALRAGNPLLALGVLRELDRKIPRGVLAEERTAARYIARCQSGEAGAGEGAAAWLEQHPRSVYATRLMAACGETTKKVP